MPIAMLRRAALLAVLAGLALLLPTAPAWAHVSLIFSDPADGAVVATAPERLRLEFDDPISEVGAEVTVVGADATVETDLEISGETLLATPRGPLPSGTVVVVWRAVSFDGHPRAGRFTFSIGSPTATPTVAIESAGVTGDLGIATGLADLALLLAGGTVASAALLRLRPGRRVRSLATASAVAAVGFGLLVVPLTGAYRLGLTWLELDSGRVWSPGLVGPEWLAWLVAAPALILARVLLTRAPRAAAAAAVLGVATPSWTGHPRAADAPLLAGFAEATHLLAAAVWLGGVAVLALGWREFGGAERQRALARFGRIAGGALLVLAAEGVLLAWLVLDTPSSLWHTAYGRLLLVKVALVALVVGWAAWRNRRAATVRTLTVEVAALAIVPLLAGFLVNLAPEPARTPASIPALRIGEAGGTRIVVGPQGDLLVRAAATGQPSVTGGGVTALTAVGAGLFTGHTDDPRELRLDGAALPLRAARASDAGPVLELPPSTPGRGRVRATLPARPGLGPIRVRTRAGVAETAYVVRADLAALHEVPLTPAGGAFVGQALLTSGRFLVLVEVRTPDGARRLLATKAGVPGSWQPRASGAPTTQARDGFVSATLAEPLHADADLRVPVALAAADGRALPEGVVGLRGAVVVMADGGATRLGAEAGALVGRLPAAGDGRGYLLLTVAGLDTVLPLDLTVNG